VYSDIEVEHFKYLGTTLTNRNSIHEEKKRKLKSENVFYNSLQAILFSSFMSKNVKIKTYTAVNYPVVSYGCETWSLTRGRTLGSGTR
jgi:hypothetical protein